MKDSQNIRKIYNSQNIRKIYNSQNIRKNVLTTIYH